MMKRILHCVLDEKFIDPLIGVINICENQCSHEYVCVTKKRKERFNFIKNTGVVDNILEGDFLIHLEEKSYNAIILHSLSALAPRLIVKIPQSINVVWIAWGYDIYQPIYGHNSLIPIKRIFHRKTQYYRFRELLSWFRNNLNKYKIRLREINIEDAINRFDYFSGIIPEEYQLIKNNKKNIFFKAKACYFSYADVTQPIKEDNIQQQFSKGTNILIGNSADETNNHMDIIQLLSNYNLKDKKVICPLSYAGTTKYVNAVVSYGKNRLGDSFTPIKNFMKYDQYLGLLSTAGYSIYYLERQQALGNIVLSIWNGNMVFLSESSVMYPFFKNRGYYIYTIQYDLWRIEKGEVLTDDQKKKNRDLLLDFCSLEATVKRDEEFFELILSTSN